MKFALEQSLQNLVKTCEGVFVFAVYDCGRIQIPESMQEPGDLEQDRNQNDSDDSRDLKPNQGSMVSVFGCEEGSKEKLIFL